MKIVAIAMAKNEADVIGEGVREGLRWADEFIVFDHGSTDETGYLAWKAGAEVIQGKPGPFNEGLRQLTLHAAGKYDPDWIWRIDVDEIYHPEPHPRQLLERALQEEAFCVRAMQLEFWLTLDDVRRGLLLEDERVSVQKRRRWYTAGHMAMVAWRPHLELAYRMDTEVQKRRNVPVTPDGRDVSDLGPCHGEFLIQKHYNCRSMHQVMVRMADRVQDLHTFGKYKYNLIIDETVGLHFLAADDQICLKDNHQLIYDWYRRSQEMYDARF